MVRDGYAMGVAPKIIVEHVLGAAERWFGVDNPIFAKQWSEPRRSTGGEGILECRQTPQPPSSRGTFRRAISSPSNLLNYRHLTATGSHRCDLPVLAPPSGYFPPLKNVPLLALIIPTPF